MSRTLPLRLLLVPAALAACAWFLVREGGEPPPEPPPAMHEAPPTPGDAGSPSPLALPFVEREEASETSGAPSGTGEGVVAAVDPSAGSLTVTVLAPAGGPCAGAKVRFRAAGAGGALEGRTDGEGRCLLAVPPGAVGLVEAEGGCGGAAGEASLEPVHEGDRVVLRLEPRRALAGRAVAAEDGSALAGVLVLLEPAGADAGEVGRTAADGTFRFSGAPAAGRLRFFHPGRRVESVAVAALARGEGDVPLRRAVPTSGVVLDEAGLPVAGAEVEAMVFAETSVGTLRLALGEARTASDGSFLLAVEPDDEGGRLEARWGAGMACVPLEPGRREPYVLVLGTAGTVEGEVVDDRGRPIAGAVVRLLGVSAGEARRRKVVTDREGKFRFAGIAAGTRAHVAASAVGRTPAVLADVVLRPEEPLRLALAPANTLEVRARLRDGRPAAFASLRFFARPPARLRASGLEGTLRLDAEGRARVTGVAPGPLVAEVTAGRSAFGRAVVEVPAAGIASLEVALDQARRVTGVVVDPLGRPIQGVRIRGPSASPRRSTEATSDGTGSFRLGPLAEGTIEVVARKRNHEPARLELPAGAVGPLRIVLVPRPPVVGRVVRREDGRPVARFRVTARGTGEGGPFVRKASFASPDGTFTLDDVPLGPLRVRVAAEGRRSRELEVEDRAAPLRFALEPAAAIRGRVVDALERPVPGLKVHLVDADGTVRRAFRTRPDGVFRFRELDPGEYAVRVASAERPLGEVRVALGLAAEDLGDLSIGATGRLLVLLRGVRRGPRPQAELRGRRYDTERTVVFGAGGRALLDGLVPDRYEVSGPGLEGKAQVLAGRTVRLELVASDPPAEGEGSRDSDREVPP